MILITGAKGFIGSHTVSYLTRKGFSVRGIDEDVRNIDKLRPYFEDVGLVIHVAARGKTTRRGEHFDVNVVGAMNIVRLCMEYGCKLIYIGTIETRGDYGISKQLAQNLVEWYRRDNDLRAVTVRLCGIYDDKIKDESGKKIGSGYPIGRLMIDLEDIITNHNFRDYKVFKIREPIIDRFIYQLKRLKRRVIRKLNSSKPTTKNF